MLRFGLHRTAAGLATTLLLLVLSAGAAEAQEFNAGARALGIGGGFQALADDATAVFWNPAGAAILGDQLHVTVGSYSRVDERGNKDNEPVPGDVNGDGAATYQDLILILGAWGPCGSPCPTDLDGNGVTGYQDLLVVLANWFG